MVGMAADVELREYAELNDSCRRSHRAGRCTRGVAWRSPLAVWASIDPSRVPVACPKRRPDGANGGHPRTTACRAYLRKPGVDASRSAHIRQFLNRVAATRPQVSIGIQGLT